MVKALLDSTYHTSVCLFPKILQLYAYIMLADGILNSNLGVSLRGSAIGNGWIDARHQYPAYLDYSVKHGLISESSKVYLLIYWRHGILNILLGVRTW